MPSRILRGNAVLHLVAAVTAVLIGASALPSASFLVPATLTRAADPIDSSSPTEGLPASGQTGPEIPPAFIENSGQFGDPDVRYVLALQGLDVGVGPGEILLRVVDPGPRGLPLRPDPLHRKMPGAPAGVRLTTAAIRVMFDGGSPVSPVGSVGALGLRHYFIGNDPARWGMQPPAFQEVQYTGLYPGIDLRLQAAPQGLKYDFLVHPGADPSVIVLRIEGADVSVLADGRLRLRTRAQDVFDDMPLAFQDGPEGRESVTAAYEVDGDLVRFALGPWDPTRSLVIDPLVYATFLGGRDGYTSADRVSLDAAGNILVVGMTLSFTFPATPGAFDGTCGSDSRCNGMYATDVFVARFSPDGTTLQWATYLGGDYEDSFASVAADAAGAVYVSGRTDSMDFPTTSGAFSRSRNGLYGDAFVTKLAADGASLVYSTYLGGSSWETPVGVAVDASGNAYVAGETWSYNFPTTSGAFRTGFGGGTEMDAFITKFSADGSTLVYSTFLAGSMRPQDLAVDGSGQAHLTGYVYRSTLPVTPGAYDLTANGDDDPFVVKLNAAGSGLVFATYLGGTRGDDGLGIAVNSAGTVFVTGTTLSPDFPTTPSAYDSTCGFDGNCDYAPGSAGGQNDAFITALRSDGTGLVFSTFFGGNLTDVGNGVAADASGRATIVGWTSSRDLPRTEEGPQGGKYGGDGYIARFSADGAAMIFGRYLSGSSWESAESVVLSSPDVAVVAGYSNSLDFPVTADAFDITSNGTSAFIAIVSTLPVLAPKASIMFSPDPSQEGQEVTFDATGSEPGASPIVSYAWAFGDGVRGSGLVFRRTFAASGMMTVVLTVTDEVGIRGTVAMEIPILPRLVPYRHGSGFGLLVPESWARRENQSSSTGPIELTLDGPVLGFPIHITVDQARNFTMRETNASLGSTMQAFLAEVQRTAPTAHFRGSLTFSQVAGHGAAKAIIAIRQPPSITDRVIHIVLVVSELHSRFWILNLSGDDAADRLIAPLFSKMVDSFVIILAVPPKFDITPFLIVVGILAAIALTAVVAVVVTWRRPSGPRQGP